MEDDDHMSATHTPVQRLQCQHDSTYCSLVKFDRHCNPAAMDAPPCTQRSLERIASTSRRVSLLRVSPSCLASPNELLASLANIKLGATIHNNKE